MKNYSFVGPIIAMTLPLVLFLCLRFGLMTDPYLMNLKRHFYIVSAIASLSTIIAIAVGIAGKRLRNIKVSFLALSFISLALLFLLHGLSTPHLLLPETDLAGVAAQLSMLLATIWLWLSSLPSDNKLVELLSGRHKLLLPVWIVLMSIVVIIGMFFPHIIVPLYVQSFKVAIIFITLLLNLITMFRYYQTYRFSRFPIQLAIVYIAGWFMLTQIIMVTGETWRLSWWIYHYLLLASMIVMLIGLVKQYATKGTLISAMRALFTNDPFERITNSISPSVKDLVIATEKKDTYTVGHTFRVTMYALHLAEELQLKPEQLRVIAQGALVHDVGKINIPDDILNKPGKLSKEEREIIEQHPVSGYDMCRELGFMKEELSIIRSHHEKWDGSGYPDRLMGDEIDLLARIVAVADVYDALTSERSYRKAWSHSEAMNVLVGEKGKHFDPTCVDAWVSLCERNPSVYLYPSTTINDDTTGDLISAI
ncbi:HD-GYP domain-containing protein [Psychrobacillus sp. FSL H8-0484]|uniref:HD-GYP domain-containing protein n=1 Tax=Psychrobacillus sp. FSL H8-0484 TaxID=2921390 RepID=UPI0030F68CA7